jgi:hypothetical protein
MRKIVSFSFLNFEKHCSCQKEPFLSIAICSCTLFPSTSFPPPRSTKKTEHKNLRQTQSPPDIIVCTRLSYQTGSIQPFPASSLREADGRIYYNIFLVFVCPWPDGHLRINILHARCKLSLIGTSRIHTLGLVADAPKVFDQHTSFWVIIR